MTKPESPESLIECFLDCKDPRRDLAKYLLLIDLLIIGILAVICGTNDSFGYADKSMSILQGCWHLKIAVNVPIKAQMRELIFFLLGLIRFCLSLSAFLLTLFVHVATRPLLWRNALV